MPHIDCPQKPPVGNTRGVAFAAMSVTMQTLATATVLLRLYSRFFLTRSAGSDDLTVVIATLFCIAGSVADVLEAIPGFGKHCFQISTPDFHSLERWTYISWMLTFLGFFFLRSSVMLFTLRLLPRTKRRSQWVIYAAFALNLAITIIAAVSYGVTCRPFSALWTHDPNAKCVTPRVLSATQQVNGILSCIVDIMTASIPAFLLWNLQVKRNTKVVLNTLFCLGMVTAALSIGRAATSSYKAFTVDTSYSLLTPLFFSLVETKLGIIMACAPALRQLYTYRKRTKTFLPSNKRQQPNADFEGMRHRVNVRDFFWRGKQDPMRAQELSNAEKRRRENSTYTSTGWGSKVDPEDSPLSVLEHRVVHPRHP